MRGRRGQPAIEIRRCEVDTVEQRLALEVQRQRDDRYRPLVREPGWEVGCRVRDDRDIAIGQSADGSSGLMSVRRRLWRSGKKRSSTGLSATSVIITRTPAVMAIA